jgi:putative addiction module component (TIGR02574 family)
MARKPDEVLRDALELPDQERAGLVIELLDSLEPVLPSDRPDDAWIAEVERRARAALAGSPSVSWEKARAQVKDRLARR